MTREDIECIIKWFSHIEQLATDGKTANGFQMPPDKILATIKVVAKDSREYVEKFCDESTPNDIEEAAWEYASKECEKEAFIAGAKWQYQKDRGEFAKIKAKTWCEGFDACKEPMPLPEDTVLFNKGVEEGKRLMMEEAVEGEVMLNPYPTICLDDCKDYDFKDGDKVRIIIVKED